MAKEKKTQGFQSAAGLIRYFDAEDSNAIQISKWAVILTCILTMMVVEISEAVGRQTGAYVLAVGAVIIIINEIRSRRSDTV
jgi:preprotein translocase subunit Sec61beta